jgi:hypothetical protein
MASAFDERQAIVDILTALEYGTMKQENEVIAALGLRDKMKKPALADAILADPGFEPFFLDVLNVVRPFSLMVTEVYEFLNSTRTTTTRRASTFLVQFEQAKARLEFRLDNFPKELLAVLGEVQHFSPIVQLQFPGVNLDNPAPQWRNTQAKTAWRALSTHWDGDFYEEFHRALSYGRTVLARGPEHTAAAEAIVGPILARLAAIWAILEAASPGAPPLAGQTIRSYAMNRREEQIVLAALPASIRSVAVVDERTRAFLAHAATEYSSILEELNSDLLGYAISWTLWHDQDHRRADPYDWLEERTGYDLSAIPPEVYLQYLDRFATDYARELDKVAPVTGMASHREVVKHLVEFLTLPFWKRRWYLYELWTLVRVLSIAERSWTVDLQNVESPQGGTIEWKLPGGMAITPVAIVGDGPQRVQCWSQRKSYHPGTGAGLEPDLRLMREEPPYHDILIIENKDRLTTRKGALAEILDRYAGGTCAEATWLVNYEAFPPSVAELEAQWSGRVRFASRFRPGSVPEEFTRQIEDLLRQHLGPGFPRDLASDGRAVGAAPSETVAITATLEWTGSPGDLDLHAWTQGPWGQAHVFYGDRGSLTAPPFGELDHDQRTGRGAETMRIASADLARATIAVHNYSDEAPLTGSNATLRVRFASAPSMLMRVPTEGAGSWWVAVHVNPADNTVEVVDAFTDDQPLG